TARHIATKLGRHFIADDPPTPLVDRLTECFLDTDGDLKELAAALIAAPESWEPEQAKIKRPNEWIVAGLRGAGGAGGISRIRPAGHLRRGPFGRAPAARGR